VISFKGKKKKNYVAVRFKSGVPQARLNQPIQAQLGFGKKLPHEDFC